MHAIKSQRRQGAQKDHRSPSLSPLSSLLSLSVSRRSPFSRMRRTRSRVFDVEARTRATSTWSQVACRGYGARTSPWPGGTCTFRVHPPLLPSTFFSAPHTPSPVPFKHNNRAVSQRVFNGRRLHATRPRAGPRPLPRHIATTSPRPAVLSLSLIFPFLSSPSFSFSLSIFRFSFFLYVSLFLARFSDCESFFVFRLPVSLPSLSLSLFLVFCRDVRPFTAHVLAKSRDHFVPRTHENSFIFFQKFSWSGYTNRIEWNDGCKCARFYVL